MKKQGGLEAAARSLLTLFVHPSALVWPLGFLRGKAPVDKLSVERHSINEGGREREEKRKGSVTGFEEQTLLIHIPPSLGEDLQKSSQSLEFCEENSETEKYGL